MLSTRPLSYQLPLMGYAVEWSPFHADVLAVSTSQNFGIIGQGQQLLLRHQHGVVTQLASVSNSDGVFDCSFSERNSEQLVFASGDGAVRLWDSRANVVLQDWREHRAEVYAVDWNLVSKDAIISGAWDNTVKLYSPEHPHSLRTFTGHSKCIYSAVWHPRHDATFASASGDGTVRIYSAAEPTAHTVIAAHQYEVLSVDFNKYSDWQLVTASTDKSVRVFDTRRPASPLLSLDGHQFAVRRVKCSPHSADIVASVSYDMSAMVWDIAAADDNVISRHEEHTEFVLGLDWNVFAEGRLATCGWDEQLLIYQIDTHRHRRRTS